MFLDLDHQHREMRHTLGKRAGARLENEVLAAQTLPIPFALCIATARSLNGFFVVIPCLQCTYMLSIGDSALLVRCWNRRCGRRRRRGRPSRHNLLDLDRQHSPVMLTLRILLGACDVQNEEDAVANTVAVTVTFPIPFAPGILAARRAGFLFAFVPSLVVINVDDAALLVGDESKLARQWGPARRAWSGCFSRARRRPFDWPKARGCAAVSHLLGAASAWVERG